MGILETIALSMGLAWASGINLYAAMLALGLAGATGHAVLPEELQILQSPLVIAAAGLMYCVEFFADKILWLDSAWASIHTVIRPLGGALLALAGCGQVELGGPAAYTPPPPGIDDIYRAELLAKVHAHLDELRHLEESKARTGQLRDELLVGAGVDFELLSNSLTFECRNPQIPQGKGGVLRYESDWKNTQPLLRGYWHYW